jgi:hypothetical protein
MLPDTLPPEGGSILTRKATADYAIDPDTGCWNWLKYCLNGYPMAGRFGRAHRAYYTIAHGPIPDGWDVHHLCRNPRCVNPQHLAAVDPRAHDVEHFMGDNGYSLELIRQVRDEGRQAGASYREVAKRYGIHFNTVRRWWVAESWNDLLHDGPVVTPPQTCELPECDKPCIGRRHKRFCCPEHRERFNHRKQNVRRRAARQTPPTERIGA